KRPRGARAPLSPGGHEVSWDGLTLLVDGRPYEVGGSLLPSKEAVPGGAPAPGEQVQSFGLNDDPHGDERDSPPPGQVPSQPAPAPTSAPAPSGTSDLDASIVNAYRAA